MLLSLLSTDLDGVGDMQDGGGWGTSRQLRESVRRSLEVCTNPLDYSGRLGEKQLQEVREVSLSKSLKISSRPSLDSDPPQQSKVQLAMTTFPTRVKHEMFHRTRMFSQFTVRSVIVQR